MVTISANQNRLVIDKTTHFVRNEKLWVDAARAVKSQTPSPIADAAFVFEFRVVDVEFDAAEGGELEGGGAEVLA